ncbi:MAG: hypothetical protein VX335_01330 [Pseudomonadota bacterium]|nr:hypothetical protein [Pseudomonadota bacterium]
MAENSLKNIAKHVKNVNNAGLIVIIASSLAIFGVPVGMLAGVIVSFYALEAPTKNFLVILLVAIIPSLIGFFMLESELSTQVFLQMTVYIFLLGIVSYTLRIYNSWSMVLQVIGLVGPGLIICLYLIFPDIDNWWLERLQAFFENADVEQSEEVLRLYSQYATGMQVMSFSFSAMITLFLARYWQACIYSKKKKLRLECLHVQLPSLSLAFIAFLGVCAILKVSWALDAFIVSLLPPFFVGASLVHLLCDKNVRKSNRVFFLIIFYMLNLIAFPFVPILVAMVGISDYILQLRKRFDLINK